MVWNLGGSSHAVPLCCRCVTLLSSDTGLGKGGSVLDLPICVHPRWKFVPSLEKFNLNALMIIKLKRGMRIWVTAGRKRVILFQCHTSQHQILVFPQCRQRCYPLKRRQTPHTQSTIRFILFLQAAAFLYLLLLLLLLWTVLLLSGLIWILSLSENNETTHWLLSGTPSASVPGRAGSCQVRLRLW